MKSLLGLLALLFVVDFSYGQWINIGGTGNYYLNSGNVGIGTTTPTALLNISQNIGEIGDYTLQRWDYGAVPTFNLQLKQHISSGLATWGFDLTNGGISYPNTLVLNNDNVGIGTTSPNAKLHIATNTASGTSDVLNQYTWSSDLVNWGLRFEQQFNASFSRIQYNWIMKAGTSSDVPMMSFVNGLVGIGTQSPDQKLTVNGTIHAKEIKVDLSVPAPDYVFKKSYKLKSLSEVAKYVALNKHLSEIPSAKVMEQNGVNVSELNMKLLQKVEELTLYLIEKDKQLDSEHKANQAQQTQIDQLKQQLQALTKEIHKNQ